MAKKGFQKKNGGAPISARECHGPYERDSPKGTPCSGQPLNGVYPGSLHFPFAPKPSTLNPVPGPMGSTQSDAVEREMRSVEAWKGLELKV